MLVKGAFQMRKILSVILCMILICGFAVPVSAAEGTAVSTAEEFMSMSPEGSYYLASDITLTSTYEAKFSGTFDGNGKTVTVSAPMFSDFSGEVKNLTIAGEINSADKDASAFALVSSSGFTAENCVNNANVTVTGNAKYASGFVGVCENNESPVVFTNCVNNGKIYIDSTAPEKPRAGGFSSIIDHLVMNNCTNNGDIYLKGNIGIAAGLVARVVYNTGERNAEAYNCVNNGNVLVEDTYIDKDGNPGTGAADAGGIFGHIGGKGNVGLYQIWGCVNNGDIDAPYRAGGLVGYAYATRELAFADIQFCINTGDITYGRVKYKDQENPPIIDFGSAFIAYTNSHYTTIKYSIDTGNIIRREGAIVSFDVSFYGVGNIFVGASSADITQYDITGIYMLNKEKYRYLCLSSLASSTQNTSSFADFTGVIDITLEDIESGRAAYEINKLAVEDLNGWAGGDTYYFYQTLGVDKFPTTDPKHGWVGLSGGKYVNTDTNPYETEPVETTVIVEMTTPALPVTTELQTEELTEPEPPFTLSADTESVTPETQKDFLPGIAGCSGVITYGAAIVAILGAAFVFKKKE